MAIIVSVTNRKGGVGKTATTINTGAALALRGVRVLLVDLDAQHNLTRSLRLDSQAAGGVFEALSEGKPLKPQKVADNLEAIAATTNVAYCEASFSARAEKGEPVRRIIEKSLEPLSGKYDVILIDTPPALGFLTVGALVASDYALIPLMAEPLAADGVGEILSTIEDIKKNLNPNLKIGGVVFTRFDKRPKLSGMVADAMKPVLGSAICKTKIRPNIAIPESTAMGLDLFRYAPESNGAKDYRELAEELATRWGLLGNQVTK